MKFSKIVYALTIIFYDDPKKVKQNIDCLLIIDQVISIAFIYNESDGMSEFHPGTIF